MKIAKYLVLFTATIAFLPSCRKEKSSNTASAVSYYVRFKVNGVQTEYKDSSYAKPEMGDVPPYHTGYFSAWKANSGVNKNKFSIRVYDTDLVRAGATYTEAIFSPISIPAACGYWYDENGVLYANMNTLSAAYSTEVQPFQTKITELTSTTVKGTFFGNLKDYKTANTTTITEGEFYLQRK
jgi:hypothetical protein